MCVCVCVCVCVYCVQACAHVCFVHMRTRVCVCVIYIYNLGYLDHCGTDSTVKHKQSSENSLQKAESSTKNTVTDSQSRCMVVIAITT